MFSAQDVMRVEDTVDPGQQIPDSLNQLRLRHVAISAHIVASLQQMAGSHLFQGGMTERSQVEDNNMLILQLGNDLIAICGLLLFRTDIMVFRANSLLFRFPPPVACRDLWIPWGRLQ